MNATLLEGTYHTSVPGEVIDLYSGELELSWNGGSVVGDGHIKLDWSPSPRIGFELTIRSGFEQVPPPSLDDDSVTLSSPEGKGKVLRYGQVFSGDQSNRKISGDIDRCFEVGNPAPVDSILFHVPNFPDYVGTAVDSGGEPTRLAWRLKPANGS